MNLETFLALVLLFPVEVYMVMRVTRFVWMDDLWRKTRERIKAWLAMKEAPDGVDNPEEWLQEWHEKHRFRSFFRVKGFDLLDCAWCISIWISAGAMLLTRWLTDIGEDIPYPVWWWLALSGGAVTLLEWTDGERHVLLKQEKPTK